LIEANEPMSPAEIVNATGMASLNVRQLLFKMVKANTVRRAGRGRYVHPDNIANKVTTDAESRRYGEF